MKSILKISYLENTRNIFHNLYGPAIEWSNGNKNYFINDKYCQNFIEYIKAVIEYKNKKENNISKI